MALPEIGSHGYGLCITVLRVMNVAGGHTNPKSKDCLWDFMMKMIVGTTEETRVFDFETFWAVYPKRPGNSKARTQKNWNARIKEGETPSAMVQGAIAYRKYCESRGTEPEYIKRSETFLGPDKHFLNDWRVMKKASFADRLTGNTSEDDGFVIDV